MRSKYVCLCVACNMCLLAVERQRCFGATTLINSINLKSKKKKFCSANNNMKASISCGNKKKNKRCKKSEKKCICMFFALPSRICNAPFQERTQNNNWKTAKRSNENFKIGIKNQILKSNKYVVHRKGEFEMKIKWQKFTIRLAFRLINFAVVSAISCRLRASNCICSI